MKLKQLLVVIAAAATLHAGDALAGDIYRYTDAEGNVHYVDRPTGVPSEQRMAISSKPTDPSQVQARVSARDSRNQPGSRSAGTRGTAADTEADEDGAAEKLTRAEKKAARREREQKCQTYRDQMEMLVTSRRLYRADENGEREYLGEAETQEARDKAQELIEANCD